VTPSVTPTVTPSITATPSVTPSPTTPSGQLRHATTTTDACNNNGDPYYTSPSCATSPTAGCRLYTNPSLTNPYNVDGYVYKSSSVGTYWRYENSGGIYQITGGQQTCPSPTPTPTPTRTPSPTPSVTPSVTPSISITPSPTPSPVTCYSQGSFNYVSSMVDCQVGSYPYQLYSPSGSLSVGSYLYSNSTCTGSVSNSIVQYGDGTNYQTDSSGQIIDIYNPGC
jgi:hypothetical protein